MAYSATSTIIKPTPPLISPYIFGRTVHRNDFQKFDTHGLNFITNDARHDRLRHRFRRIEIRAVV